MTSLEKRLIEELEALILLYDAGKLSHVVVQGVYEWLEKVKHEN